MRKDIEVEKRVHKIYEEFEIAKKANPGIKLRELVGKWQYIYKSKKGQISLIKLVDFFSGGIELWEIYEQSGNDLFEDVERFLSKEEAEKRIEVLLC